jgi:DNA repair exonuclease SbcCD ATPase subunit
MLKQLAKSARMPPSPKNSACMRSAVILVITHLEDLRERLPVRIEVSNTPQGSTYVLR